ncbi:mitogen-activated protein kinase kinase kinase 14 [Alosa pseudoharengus]|uniref:mitogen-activated protein kinase kinase kinase 14 n=1 Tax=Alosa pseudoharengus TaxID=34774 RepID=UPI003F8C73EC
MAVTTRRILNSTMPFRGPALKGSFDKSIYADASTTEPHLKQKGKTEKVPGADQISDLLVRVLTQGSAEQVGTGRSPECSSPFIAQAQCESQDSQEFSPTGSEKYRHRDPQAPYVQHTRHSPHQSSHRAPAEVLVAAATVDGPQPVGKRRRKRKHRPRRRTRNEHQQQEEARGEVRRERAHTGVPEQESGEIPPQLHPFRTALSEGGLSECSSSSSDESGWVQETGDWVSPSSSHHCLPFGQPSLDAGGMELAVQSHRNTVNYEDKTDGREYITPLVEAMLRDYREKEDKLQEEDINEGLVLHEKLQPVEFEYREGREYTSNLIKSGSYGDVCRVRDNSTGFVCAAKKVPLSRFKSGEVGAWSCLLPLACVVDLFGAVREGPNMILFMDLKSGSLGQLLEQRGRIPEDLALYYFTQGLEALEYLHQRQILHLDVKADNMLLSEDGKNIFLCDFGHSEKLNTPGECIRVNTEMKGTETHMAPEMVKAERCGTKADVWSSSCMLLHLLTGCHPWTRLYSRPLYLTIANEPPPLREIPPDCCPLVTEVLKAGLEKEPIRRASAQELRVQATRALQGVGGLTSPVKGPYVKPLKKLAKLSPAPSDATTPMSTPTPTPHPTPPAPSTSSGSLSAEPGRKGSHSRRKTSRQHGEQEELETEGEEGQCAPPSPAPAPLHTGSSPVIAELRKLERDFFLTSLSQLHSAELQEQLLSCLSSEGPSHLDLWDKKDSGRWSLSPGEELSSGVFSGNSQSESQSFGMEWRGTPTLRHTFCLGGVEVCIQDFSGRRICIREKPRVSVGHIARGISEQISEPVFSLQSMDGCPVSHDEEMSSPRLLLHCVHAPDCNHSPATGHTPSCMQSWRWRIKNGRLETKN